MQAGKANFEQSCLHVKLFAAAVTLLAQADAYHCLPLCCQTSQGILALTISALD